MSMTDRFGLLVTMRSPRERTDPRQVELGLPAVADELIESGTM